MRVMNKDNKGRGEVEGGAWGDEEREEEYEDACDAGRPRSFAPM